MSLKIKYKGTKEEKSKAKKSVKDLLKLDLDHVDAFVDNHETLDELKTLMKDIITVVLLQNKKEI